MSQPNQEARAMSLHDAPPQGTEEGREDGERVGLEWQVDNIQTHTVNVEMEEPVLWARSS